MARHVMSGDQPFSAHQFTHCSSTASGASRHRRASTSLLAMRRVSTEEDGQWDTFARAPLGATAALPALDEKQECRSKPETAALAANDAARRFPCTSSITH